jgi:hypothetical protein
MYGCYAAICVILTLCVVLSVMCICVIYKCLKFATLICSKINASQAIGVGSSSRVPKSRGEWKDSVCFERGARMDSFAVVLTTPGYSSMYIYIG